MKRGARVFLVLLLPVMALSCAASNVNPVDRQDPQYMEGYELGVETAGDDRVDIQCSDIRLGMRPMLNARRHGDRLVSEGRPQLFVTGFREGYRKTYDDFILNMCN